MSYKQRHPYLMQIVYIIKCRLKNLRDCTPVIADLHTSKAQVVTESMVIKYVPENYTMDGIRCDIAIGFGQLGKIIATGNTRDDLMDERELAKYIVDNETISENENIECRR